MNRYRVSYHTSPSPALTYYEGAITVWAEDEESAETAAIRELVRKSPDYRGAIVIDEVNPA